MKRMSRITEGRNPRWNGKLFVRMFSRECFYKELFATL